jgi:hypothetical protein
MRHGQTLHTAALQSIVQYRLLGHPKPPTSPYITFILLLQGYAVCRDVRLSARSASYCKLYPYVACLLLMLQPAPQRCLTTADIARLCATLLSF